MNKFLKGNFEVTVPIDEVVSEANEAEKLVMELRKKVLTTLGGSMVYMERRRFNWDGDENGNVKK